MNRIVRRFTEHITTSNPCFKQAFQLCLAGADRCPNRKCPPAVPSLCDQTSSRSRITNYHHRSQRLTNTSTPVASCPAHAPARWGAALQAGAALHLAHAQECRLGHPSLRTCNADHRITVLDGGCEDFSKTVVCDNLRPVSETFER